ncbi:hypothetical protein BGZ46_001283, partial [Entomortierella lignicola]
FKEVFEEYGITRTHDPDSNVPLPLPDVEEATMQSTLYLECKANLTDYSRRTSILQPKKKLSGRQGHELVDYLIHARSDTGTDDYTLGVTEIKKKYLNQGVAPNIVQLESALTSRKRKWSSVGTEELQLNKVLRSYGIVTDAEKWYVLECSMGKYENVSYKMSSVEKVIDYQGN